MLGIQNTEVILLVILILFGGKKIPELMGGVGKGMRNFKKALNEPDEDEKTDVASEAAKLEKQKQELEAKRLELEKKQMELEKKS